MTEKISRTAVATAARMRASEEKLAQKLRERGWAVATPETREMAENLLTLCGWCDAGLPMTCTCPDLDLRSVIQDLITDRE